MDEHARKLPPPGTPDPPGDLTWPMLLAHWTAFAQASAALPKTPEGDTWRAATPAIIALQAVTLALRDIDRLSPSVRAAGHAGDESERAVGLDRAAVIIRTQTADLRALFPGGSGGEGRGMHAEVTALIDDARHALAAARASGLEWRVQVERLTPGHPGELVALVLSTGFDGDLYVPSPGVDLFRESPAAFCHQADGGRPHERVIRAIKEFLVDVSRPERVPGMRQVYRQFDFAAGGAVRDYVVSMDAELPAGQPLLVPAILEGREVSVTLPPRRGAPVRTLPVVFAEKEEGR